MSKALVGLETLGDRRLERQGKGGAGYGSDILDSRQLSSEEFGNCSVTESHTNPWGGG